MRSSRFATVSLALVFGAVVPAASHAGTLRVPSEYPSVNSAVAAAHDGDVVLVAPGNYTEIISLNQANGITVRGEKHVRFTGTYPVYVQFSDRFTLENIEVVATDSAVNLHECTRSRVTKCKVSGDLTWAGIQLYSCENSRVDACSVTSDTMKPGIRMLSCTQVEIAKNRLELPHGTGVYDDGVASLIRENSIESDHAAIECTGASTTVTKNKIDGAAVLVAGTHVRVDGNSIKDSSSNGLQIEDSTNVLISSNAIKNAAGAGVLLDAITAQNCSLVGNRISKCDAYGVVFETGIKGLHLSENSVKSSGVTDIKGPIAEVTLFDNKYENASP